MKLWQAAVGVAIAAGIVGGVFACNDPGPLTAEVFVEKLVAGASGQACYAMCAGATAANLRLPGDCPQVDADGDGGDDGGAASAVPCGFAGGLDTMRVVVDYGNVNINSGSGFTGPQLVVNGDGTQVLTRTMTLGPLGTGSQRPYAMVEALAPAHAVEDLEFQVSLTGGDLVQPQGSYSVVPLSTAIVSVERLVAQGSGTPCYAACVGSTAPASDLDLPQDCAAQLQGGAGASPVACAFAAGIDTMRVIVDYGNVVTSSADALSAPQLQVIGDGVTLSTSTMTLGAQKTGPQRAFATFESLVPSRIVNDLAFQIALVGGDLVSPAGSYSVGPLSGATVSVEELIPQASGQPCYMPCQGSAAPATDLKLPDDCVQSASGAAPSPVACGFLAGVDTMRVVVDYGSVVPNLGSGSSAPQLQVTGDGVTLTTSTMTMGPQSSGVERPFATLELPAPSRVVNDLEFQVSLLGGDLVSPGGSYSVVPLNAVLTLEKLIQGQSGPCFATCAGSTSPRSVLPLVGASCGATSPVSCGFVAGADKMRIVADYGDVAVASVTGFAGANLLVTGDGAQLVQTALPLAPLTDGGSPQRAFSEVELTAPAQTVSVLGIQASLPGGAIDSLAATFTVEQPTLGVSVDGCTSARPCTEVGGTAAIPVTVTVPGTQPANVTLSTTVDGVLQQGTQSLVASTLTILADSSQAVQGTAFLTVPSARGGAAWVVQAQSGGASNDSPSITIQAPVISAAFTCGSSCTFKAGSTVGLVVSAPIGSSAIQATINTLVGGAPSLVGSTLSLTTVNANVQTISGVLQLPVPNAVGSSWELDATVGAYAAQSLIVQITM